MVTWKIYNYGYDYGGMTLVVIVPILATGVSLGDVAAFRKAVWRKKKRNMVIPPVVAGWVCGVVRGRLTSGETTLQRAGGDKQTVYRCVGANAGLDASLSCLGQN